MGDGVQSSGGNGGGNVYDSPGGAGGTGPNGMAGGNGQITHSIGTGGGGGSAGGGSGGRGGGDGSSANDGGAGGTANGNINGSNGNGPFGGGGGGAGGKNGIVGSSLNPNQSYTGGIGGNGGNSGSENYFGGGGGGGGGYGAVLSGNGSFSTNATIAGGNGGNGGDGGVGLDLLTSGASFTNAGTIQGGNGGGAGSGAGRHDKPGMAGGGGVGVVGSNLTIDNSTGTITGGMSGDGVTQAEAIAFTSGTNNLTLGGTINGNIGISGTLNLATAADTQLGANIDDSINGAGAVVYASSSRLYLSGFNSYSGSTTIENGTLAIYADFNLGDASGAVTIIGGTLEIIQPFGASARNFSISGACAIDADFNPFVIGSDEIDGTVTDGASAGSLTVGGGGTLVLANAGNTYSGGTTVVGGSTVSVASDSALGNAAARVTLNGGTLEMSQGFTTGRKFALGANDGGITVDAGTGTINTAITGRGAVFVAGAGSLTLANARNSYSGGTIIAGTLDVSSDADLGAVSGSITLGQASAGSTGTMAITGAGFTSRRNIAISGFGDIEVVDPGDQAVLSGVISDADSQTPASWKSEPVGPATEPAVPAP